MISTHTLLSSLLISLLVNSIIAIPTPRAPLASLPITRHVNAAGSSKLADADRARANILKSLAFGKAAGQNGSPSSFPVTNKGVTYTVDVGVGSPATTYTLIIDTGSSNTWIGANKPYVQTTTSKPTQDKVSVVYGSGLFAGNEFIDQVALSKSLVIGQQSIGVATTSQGFQGVDGILGIGPVDLTVGTLIPDTNTPIPTVTDNLFTAKRIPQNSIGISFEPTTSASVTNGEMTFGGTDPTKYTGNINYVPITSTSPASHYWGIDESIVYGDSTPILSSTAGIVDTGTTLILLATDAYNRYAAATGAMPDVATSLLKITPSQFNNLKDLKFIIGGITYVLTPNGQIWPRSLNTFIGGDSNSIYLVVGDLGKPSGQGLDFINGYTFLERFYSVYDTTNKRVGLATTPFTTATTN